MRNFYNYLKLSKDEVQDIDQYLYRFCKLQDAMGGKLFKLIVQRFDENTESLSIIDILNKLEKMGLLSSSDEWKALGQLRNNLAHDYEDNPDSVDCLLNSIFSKKVVIEDIYLRLKCFVNNDYKLNFEFILFDKLI